MSERVPREVLFKNGDKYAGFLDENDLFTSKGIYIFKERKMIYDGEFFKGKHNGKGRLYSTESNNPFKIEGEFLNGVPEGSCSIIYQDGSEYMGQMLGGKKHGKGTANYKITSEEQVVPVSYTGDFKNDLMEGNGKMVFSDNSVYTGEFKSNSATGRGKLISPECTFSGYFLMNKKDGEGVALFPNGEKYEGEYKENMKHGKGKYFYSDGSSYEGQWAFDEKEGSGSLKIKTEDGKFELYTGEFRNGVFEGKGTYDATISKGFAYYGEFKNNMANGRGDIRYGKQGTCFFRGNFMKNNKHGECEFHVSSGEVYKGEFILGSEKIHKANFGSRK